MKKKVNKKIVGAFVSMLLIATTSSVTTANVINVNGIKNIPNTFLSGTQFEIDGILVKLVEGYDVFNENDALTAVKKITENNDFATVESAEPVFSDLDKNTEKKCGFGLTRWLKISVPEHTDMPKEIKKYQINPMVECAELNAKRFHTCSSFPNDYYFPQQWHLHQSNDCDIDAPEGWDIEKGRSLVTIAIVDTGVDYWHEDLWWNYLDWGYDFVNNDNDPKDDNGHGTHCAGIAAAEMDNLVGVAGVSQVIIIAEKVLDELGGGYSDDVANGIMHAADNWADVISMSLGSYIPSSLIEDAVNYAYYSDIVLVGAAGNNDTDDEFYPAAYYNVIAVGATDQYDSKATFSNYGYWVDVAAPGVDIFSTMPEYWVTLNDYDYDMNYDEMSGTSMATPIVAGVAALVISQDLLVPNWIVVDKILDTADDIGEPGLGSGRINTMRALNKAPTADVGGPYEGLVGKDVKFNGVGSHDNDDNEPIVKYDWKFFNGDTWHEDLGPTPKHKYTTKGVYTVTLRVTDDEEDTDIDTTSVHIFSEVIHVPSEYPTIQAAIDATIDGMTILVADGTYTGQGNRDIQLNGKTITVKSENGPNNCIIDCNREGIGFYLINSHEGRDSIIKGFTVTHGWHLGSWYGAGGIHACGSSATVEDCIFIDNYGFFGAIFDECNHNGGLKIVNCIINNSGGITSTYSSTELIHCTVTNNKGIIGFDATIVCHGDYSPVITNCIFWNNAPKEIYCGDNDDPPIVNYSDIKGGYLGKGNTNADPIFAKDGYHLSKFSPCIDAGTNAGVNTDIDGDPRPDNSPFSGGFDIGADEKVGRQRYIEQTSMK